MKKIFTRIMLWAVAATALASCANNDINDAINDNNLIEVTLTADKTAVRTELIEGVPYWSKGDAVGAYFADAEGNYKNYKFENKAEKASLIASFTGQTEVANTLYVYYPYASNGVTEGRGAKVDIPTTQTPTATSFDGKADLMIAKPITLDAAGKTLENLQFARVGAVVKIVLKDKTNNNSLTNQHISSFSMTAADNLVGRVYLDVENQTINGWCSNPTKTVKATYAEPLAINGENGVYVIVYPQTLAAGSTLSFEAATEGYAISKSITLPQDIVLESGKVTTLNVSLEADHLTVVESGRALPFDDDFSWAEGNATSAALTDDKLPEGYETSKQTAPQGGFIKFGNSSNQGYITTKELNLSQPFTVVVDAKRYGSDTSKLYVTIGDVTMESENLGEDFKTYMFEFDAISAKEAVTIGVSGKRGYIDNLHIVEGHDYVLPPVLTVTTEAISNVSHEGATETFTYSVANPVNGVNVAINDNANWITTSVSGTTVTVTIEANESEEAREGVITVTYGDLTKQVAVSQNGKPAEGGATEVVDVLTQSWTGITGSSYTAWSGKTLTSSAVYAGQSAGSNSSIQLRATSPSGVITTTSGGKVAKIKVTWNSNTNTARVLQVYGNNTAYTATTDLYNDTNKGTLLGEISYSTTPVTLEIEGDYKYIGFRSKSSAMYLSQVEITWVTGDSDSGDDSGNTGGDDSGDDSGNTGGDSTLGTTWSYTFTASQWTANGSKTLNGLTWTLAGDGGYWAYDGTKGQHLGSGSKPYKSLTLSTTDYTGGVKTIKVNTSGGSSVNATLTVTVGGTQIGSAVKITSSATDYTFSADAALTGEIKLSYTQTSSKAIYIKSIQIN